MYAVRDLHDYRSPQLTPTQTRVFQSVQSGLSNREIAHELGIAEATVKIHMTALMRRLSVRNRTQVAVLASGLLHGGGESSQE
jgi:DNA-binding NarL/FixJ family response regulator